MLEHFYKRKGLPEKLRAGPLAQHLDLLAEYLSEQGYSTTWARNHLHLASHLSLYAASLGIRRPKGITPIVRDEFVRLHLPACRCYAYRVSSERSAMTVLRHVMDVLQLPQDRPPRTRRSAADRLLSEYETFLLRHRGVTPTTVYLHNRPVESFLKTLGPSVSRTRCRRLTRADVVDFYSRHMTGQSRSYSRRTTCALRSFLRFLMTQGWLRRDLAEGVPSVPHFQQATLPKGLPWPDVEKFLSSLDRTTEIGKRDYAMFLLLATYGVRSCQVRKLKLKDILWDKEAIGFPACKGGRPLVLPLLPEVGQAIVDYLKNGRPASSYKEVFLTAIAPRRPLCPTGLQQCTRTYLQRAHIRSNHKGTHLFRHAFATRLVQQGQPFKAIADLLGHQDLSSTQIYAKVDIENLRDVGLPWPGGIP